MTVKKKLAVILAAIAIVLVAAAVSLLHETVIAPSAEGNDDLKIEVIGDDSDYLKNGYTERYGIPADKFECAHNGGEEAGAPFSNAFDRNFNSVWRSELQYKSSDKAGTTNYVEVTFSSPMLLDRIIYRADSSWYDRGYPNTLKISYIKDGGSAYTALEELSSAPTDKPVLITLSQKQTVTKIKLEWIEVNPRHRTCAAASEIIFLQPHSSDIEAVQNMFVDYAQLELADDIKSTQDIEELREKVKGYASYESELSGLITRAEQVLAKTVVYDPRREMGTDPGSENVLNRYGDVAGYARSTLKMAWFGTNRQATGISATPDDVLTVYVTGNANDPLPSLVVTQFWGSWSSWRSGEYKLRLGKNVIRPGNYVQAGFTTNTGDPIPPGGPVYLTNPYTPQSQSENVKVYIEGGTLFPLYRAGGDEGLYYNRLREYSEYVENDKESSSREGKVEKAIDVTEIVSRNIILTVRASLADTVYNTQGYSVETACKGWDDYVSELLVSDGVVIDEADNKYNGKYDDRAKYLNCNIRLMQPFGAAYAHIEHVGIQVSWERGALLGSGFGWGYTHELGHMMDIGERTVSECSNNMLSKYNETAMERTATRGDFAKTTAALAPDDRSVSSYWNTNRGNFIIWWLIESFEIGYWPRMENLYRYEQIPVDYGKMSATEKQVYLSSLSVGYDLSYYFERWGYNLSSSDFIFKAATASDAFKSLMAAAKNENRIKDGYQPKIWYLDAAEYLLRKEGEENTKLYTSADKPVLEAVTKCSEGYSLFIRMDKSESPAHLGFEILEGTGANKRVVGFSYEQAFTDTTEYASGYTPVYTVVAYDRALQTSAESNALGLDEREAVCRIGNKNYSSLYGALLDADDGDEIVILKDCYTAALTIDKAITISTDGAERKLGKVSAGAIFNIARGGSLTLKGTEQAKLVLDGNSFVQTSPLIRAEGNLTARYCIFQNNIIRNVSGGVGGAIYAAGAAESTVNVESCEFRNNSAWCGGAVYVKGSYTECSRNLYKSCVFTNNIATDGGAVYIANSRAQFEDCTFSKNIAEGSGGAIAVCSGSICNINNCTVTENSATLGGGIFADSATTVTEGEISKNTASAEGGAIYYSTSISVRAFCISGAKIGENVCGGSAVYLSGNSSMTETDISEGDCTLALSAAGGTLSINGGKISKSFFISESCTVSVKDNLVGVYEGEKIKIFTDKQLGDEEGEDDVITLFTSSFSMESSAAGSFESGYGEVAVGYDGKSLCLTLETIKVYLQIGKSTVTKRFLPGQVLVLDDSSGDEKTYVAAWKKDGEEYHAGDSVTVNEQMTFVADVRNKIKITYHYTEAEAGNDFEEYYIPGESYTLKSAVGEKYVLNGWENSGTLYLPYATLTAAEDATYASNLTPKLKVEYIINDINGENPVTIAVKYHAYGERIKWVKIENSIFTDGIENYLPAGKSLDGYCLYGSEDKIDFDTFTVTSDLQLIAVIADNPVYITYVTLLNGSSLLDSKTDLAKPGTSYTLALNLIPYGYHTVALTMFDADEQKIPFDSQEDVNSYTIENVSSPYYIVYADVAKNVYDVTYQYNGEDFKTDKAEYETKITLEEPQDMPEKYHFTSYLIGKPQLVMTDDGSYEMQNVELNMQLGDEITVTENTVINILVYIEGEEQLPEAPEKPDGPEAPDDPSDDPSGGQTDSPDAGSPVVSGCAGCGSTDIGGDLTLGGGVAATLLLLIALTHVIRRKKRMR